MNAKCIGKIFFLVCIANSLMLCSSIQPKPDGNDWIRCPNCKGYGTIEVIDKTAKPRDRNQDESAGSCFSPFAWTDNYDQKKYDIDKNKNTGRYDGQNDNYYELRVKMKKTSCHNCNGKGWLKKTE